MLRLGEAWSPPCDRWPWKLVLVRRGNLGLRATQLMFASHRPKIEVALQNGTLVELTEERVEVLVGWRCSILAFLPEDGPPMSWSTAKRSAAAISGRR